MNLAQLETCTASLIVQLFLNKVEIKARSGYILNTHMQLECRVLEKVCEEIRIEISDIKFKIKEITS